MKPPTDDHDKARVALLDALEASGALPPDWRRVFEAVPRHLFVPPAFRLDGIPHDRGADEAGWFSAVYSDAAIVTQIDDGGAGGRHGPTSSTSRPDAVARMLRALDLREGDRVLEVGTGTGWNAALMAERLGGERVFTIEIDPAVMGTARENLRAAGSAPRLRLGDGERGWPSEAPFDRLIATAAVRWVPPAWLAQVRPGGVVVLPLATAYTHSHLVRLVTLDGGGARGRFFDDTPFMSVRGQRVGVDVSDESWRRAREAGGLGTFTTARDLGDFEAPGCLFGVGVQLADVRFRARGYGPDEIWWSDGVSWAHLTPGGGPGRNTVEHVGPRPLWDEVVEAYERWVAWGRPGYDRFGLTVREDGSHEVWLDEPGTVVARRGVAEAGR